MHHFPGSHNPVIALALCPIGDLRLVPCAPTPDAVSLLDRANGLLFTGDTYYPAPIWLYRPETDLDAYARSIRHCHISESSSALRHLKPKYRRAIVPPPSRFQLSG
jgi:hypothetical protein